MIADDIAVRASESVKADFGDDFITADIEDIAQSLINFIFDEAGESGYRLNADEARRWAARLQSEARDDVRRAGALLAEREQDEAGRILEDGDV